MKKRGIVLGLVMVLVVSLFATSFASSESGGSTTMDVPPRIIGW